MDENIDNAADILFFKVDSVMSDDVTIKSSRGQHINKIASEEEARALYVVPWGKILRKSLLDQYGIIFEETRWANDCWFSCMAGVHADRVSVLQDVLYVVTSREGSLTNVGSYGADELITRAWVFFRCYNMLSQAVNYQLRYIVCYYLMLIKRELGYIYFIKACKSLENKAVLYNNIIKESSLMRKIRNYVLFFMVYIIPVSLLPKTQYDKYQSPCME